MTTKSINIFYWVSTLLFAALMIFTAIPNLLNTSESITLIHDQLGYPLYFILYIGLCKILGSITILIPGLKKIKEWAYAGLFFDLVSSVYSGIAVAGKFDVAMLFMLIWFGTGILSYYFWSKKVKA